MKALGRSFIMAFSGYSISPKSKLERNKENCSYILIFIPVIGAIICALINRWAVLFPYMCDFPVLPAVVGAVVPTILSAGAHLDGFFRTTDALSSHKSMEEKLDILNKDAHGGYSSIIVCVCMFLISVGIWSEMPIDGIPILAIGFVMSRALFGLSILTLNHADESKCVSYVPDNPVLRMAEIIILGVLAMIGAYFMVFFNASVGLACVVGALLTFLYYWLVTHKHFGGITEDSAGFFLQLCEINIPLAALLAYKKWW